MSATRLDEATATSKCAQQSVEQEQDLDLVTAFRETVLAGWGSYLRPKPHGMLRAYHVGVIEKTVLMIPAKSLDSRPDGSPWLCSMDRILTPPSLEDLGRFSLAAAAQDPTAMLQSVTHESLPYCICPATRSIAIVQHKLGYSPTDAPFMFVGQRQEVESVVAVPWNEAAKLVEEFHEAQELGPVLVVQMTGRCGSTVLTKALEWLNVGCQSVSEPTIFADVHEMLERGLCTREEAIRTLRSSMLMLVHQRRRAHPDRPMIIIKNRTLAATWRHCELLPEALPGIKQIFQWRTTEDVVGSFTMAAEDNMISPTAHYLAQRGMDGVMWHLNGRPAARWMDRSMAALRGEPSLTLRGADAIEMDAQLFTRNGQLGFLTFMSIMDAHIGVALGQRGLWSLTLRYEDLMSRKSACVRDVLQELGWLHFVLDASILGTAEADNVFFRDAHAGGGLCKHGGTTLGGNQQHLQSSGPAAATRNSEASLRENAHLPLARATIVRSLMQQHAPLNCCGYDLGVAANGDGETCRAVGQCTSRPSTHAWEGGHSIGGA